VIGTDWISVQPDPWTAAICDLAARLGVVVFLAMPERDTASNLLYNATFAIDRAGAICGKHRKINALRAGSEAWSTPGTEASPIAVDGRGVGVMICADAGRSASRKSFMRGAPSSWFRLPHGRPVAMGRRENGSGQPLTRVFRCLSAIERAMMRPWTFRAAKVSSRMAEAG
jgi:hypothetical protein